MLPLITLDFYISKVKLNILACILCGDCSWQSGLNSSALRSPPSDTSSWYNAVKAVLWLTLKLLGAKSKKSAVFLSNFRQQRPMSYLFVMELTSLHYRQMNRCSVSNSSAQTATKLKWQCCLLMSSKLAACHDLLKKNLPEIWHDIEKKIIQKNWHNDIENVSHRYWLSYIKDRVTLKALKLYPRIAETRTVEEKNHWWCVLL